MSDLATATWASVIISALLVIVTAIFYMVMYLQNRKMLKRGLSQIEIMNESAKASIEQTAIMQKQLEMLIKERGHPRIVELIQHVLSPFIHQLDVIIGQRETYHIAKRYELMLHYGDDGYLHDFIRKHPNLYEMIDNFNRLNTVSVNTKIDDLMKEINTPKFRKKCDQLIIEYNQKWGKLPEHNLLSDDYATIDKEYCPRFALHIIQSVTGNLGGGKSYNKFWEEYGDELLKVRSEKNIRNKLTELERLWNEYIKKAQEVKGKLEEQRQLYGEEYEIPRKEFYISGL